MQRGAYYYFCNYKLNISNLDHGFNTRFITEDSVEDPNNPNEYAYYANNPVNNIDPTGHISIKPQSGLGMVGAIISAVDTQWGFHVREYFICI